jgi:hypothetical protein
MAERIRDHFYTPEEYLALEKRSHDKHFSGFKH